MRKSQASPQKLADLLNKDVRKLDVKLKEQQDYYRRLVQEGIAEKQAYDLKPVASTI